MMNPIIVITIYISLCLINNNNSCYGADTTKEDDVEFDVVFHQPTLGLELSPELVVIGFAKKATASHGNVHVGDKIVAVNGKSLAGLSGIAASRVIKSAAAPRKLTFRSTVKGLKRVIVDEENLSESFEKRDYVQILTGTGGNNNDNNNNNNGDNGAANDPDEGVAGRLPFASALFGPTKSIDIGGKGTFSMAPAKNFSWCKPYQLVFAEPRDACGALRNEKDVFNKIVIVHRGTCSFVTKAWQLQASGAVAMIVINVDSSIFRMPEGNLDTDGLKIASFMLQLDALMALEPLIMDNANSHSLRARFITPNACKDIEQSTKSIVSNLKLTTSNNEITVDVNGDVVIKKNNNKDGQNNVNNNNNNNNNIFQINSKKYDGKGGRIIFRSKTGKVLKGEFLHFLTGSKTLPSRGVTLNLANPANACKKIDNVIPGSWVYVERGGCSFYDKILHSSRANAGGILIVNDMPGLAHGKGMKAGTTVDKDDSTHIPTVMISGSLGRTLSSLMTLPAVVELQFDDNIFQRWNELIDLENLENWPKNSNEQRAFFKTLSMLNHPDKSGGNNERFSYLKSLYDKADRALSLNGNSNDDELL